MSFLKQRKNKRFSYKPRHERTKQDDINNDIESKWQEVRAGTKRKGNFLTSLPILIILCFMVLILMYVLNRYQ